jgi:hypothetical protein
MLTIFQQLYMSYTKYAPLWVFAKEVKKPFKMTAVRRLLT